MQRVTIITKKESARVFDGLGGKHKNGDTPELPDDVVQDLFNRGLAVPFGVDGEAKEQATKALKLDDVVRDAEAYKPNAEAAMQKHDALPADQRLAAHDRLPGGVRKDLTIDTGDDGEWDDDSLTETLTQALQPGSLTPTTDSSSTPSKTPLESLIETKNTKTTKTSGKRGKTSGSKRRSRKSSN